MIKVKYRIRTDIVGSPCENTIEIEDEVWNSLSEDEKEKLMQEYAFDHIDWGFDVLDD